MKLMEVLVYVILGYMGGLAIKKAGLSSDQWQFWAVGILLALVSVVITYCVHFMPNRKEG